MKVLVAATVLFCYFVGVPALNSLIEFSFRWWIKELGLAPKTDSRLNP
jgi:hypothetical protein